MVCLVHCFLASPLAVHCMLNETFKRLQFVKLVRYHPILFYPELQRSVRIDEHVAYTQILQHPRAPAHAVCQFLFLVV